MTAATPTGGAVYYEDVDPGRRLRTGVYSPSDREIIDFATSWDPMPMHTDPEAAAASRFGGLTAPGSLILAIKQRLVHELGLSESIVASMGFDDLRFLGPLRSGDAVAVEVEMISKRLSRSNPGCGVVVLAMAVLNQRGETILRHRDTVLMRLRGA